MVVRYFLSKTSQNMATQPNSRPRWKKVLAGLVVAGVVLGVLGVLGLSIAVAWVSRDLPDPNSLVTRDVPLTTKIYDRTGQHLLTEIHGDENRTMVQIKDLPSFVPHATVAIEDKNFYNHKGVSWRGIARAFLTALQRGRVQGTSTLTQQLVKNAILTDARTPDRKMREIILALQLERTYTKDQILQMYLNEIPYGSTVYGIESAAQTFFGKASKDLTLDEAALLAALPQSPSRYSPYGSALHGDNRETLVGRQHYILDQMAEQGYVTREQADAAKQVETLKKILPRSSSIGDAPHFTRYVRDLLEESYGSANVARKGYKVITTLDYGMQKVGEEETKKGVDERGKSYGFTNAALVALDPKNGQILAMVGSHDFNDKEHDGEYNVVLSPRQPGSSFKPIVYAAAFEKGYTPDTTLWDVDTVFKTDSKDYIPKNYDFKEHGPVSMRAALQGSLNIAAVKALYLVGVGRVIDFAEALGYTTFGERSRFSLALVLGGGEVKLLEHAGAYAAFANDGILHPSSAILRVEDAGGNVVQEWKPAEGKRVVSEATARRITDVMADNQARAYVFGTRSALTLGDRPSAAKSGTTNNFHDAWTMGYTPSLVAGVWVGNNDNKEMKTGADGSKIAGPIWQAFMKRSLNGKPAEKFAAPPVNDAEKAVLRGKAHEYKVKVDTLTGLRATETTPPEFIEERTAREAHDILWYVDKDDPRGPAPVRPQDDPQFVNWESGVQAWVRKTNWISPTTTPPGDSPAEGLPTEGAPKVSILEPAPNSPWGSRQGAVRVEIQGDRRITSVQAVLDGRIVGSTAAAPWSVPVRIPSGTEKGTRILLIVATDEAGRRGTASLPIDITLDPAKAETSVLSLADGAKVSAKTLPFPVALQVANLADAKKVDLYLQSADGSTRLLGSDIAPTKDTVTIVWKTNPGLGSYTLFPVITNGEGNSHAGQGIAIQLVD